MADASQASLALVTGAASGIGRAVAERLAGRHKALALWDLDKAQCQQTARELSVQYACDARAYTCDVRSQEQVQQATESMQREQGVPSALALVAGVLRQGTATGTASEDWTLCMETNAQGVFNVAQACVPLMMDLRRGAVVTVASNAARIPRLDMAAYAASKAAAAMFTRCLGLEVAHLGIRCNVVLPGSTATPMLKPMLDAGGSSSLITGELSRYRLGIPLARLASPADVAAGVDFLLSDAARHITLHELVIDGGATP